MRHLDVELVSQVLAGQLPPAVLVQVIYEHVKELCPHCAETLELLQGEPLGDLQAAADADLGEGTAEMTMTAVSEPRYATAFERTAQDAVGRAGRVDDEQRRARRDLAELLCLDADQRKARVVGAHTRFRSRALAELLLRTAREETRNDPGEAASLAELAVTVLLWTPGALAHDWAEVVKARSLALRANAHRAAGELRCADDLFVELRRYLGRHALGDYELHGEVCNLEASLRIDQRRIEEAEALLDRAVLFYRYAQHTEGVASSLVLRGVVLSDRGDHEAADASLLEALSLLSPDQDRHLYLCAVSNRARVLCNLERCHEARRLVDANAHVYRGSEDAWTRLRHRWLEGTIARGLGELKEAETALQEVRQAFLAEEQGFKAAVVSLDLALVYLELGRMEELRRLTHGMSAVFAAEDLQREPMAALMLFQQAVAAETVTAEAIRSLRSHLERTRNSPRRHEQPS